MYKNGITASTTSNENGSQTNLPIKTPATDNTHETSINFISSRYKCRVSKSVLLQNSTTQNHGMPNAGTDTGKLLGEFRLPLQNTIVLNCSFKKAGTKANDFHSFISVKNLYTRHIRKIDITGIIKCINDFLVFAFNSPLSKENLYVTQLSIKKEAYEKKKSSPLSDHLIWYDQL